MSKIFETLNRGDGELADLIRPVVNGESASLSNDATKPNRNPERRVERVTQPQKPATESGDSLWEGVPLIGPAYPCAIPTVAV